MMWLGSKVTRLFTRLEEERRQRHSNMVAMVVLLIGSCLLTYSAARHAADRALRNALLQSASAAPLASVSVGERTRFRVTEAASPSLVLVTTHEHHSEIVSLTSAQALPNASTGFFWDERGHVVTRARLAAEATGHVAVRLHNGRLCRARLVGVYPELDLAVFRVVGHVASRPLPIAGSEGLRVGQSVHALGKTLGRTCSLSTGVVSALDRTFLSASGATVAGLLQTDAVISLDNAGGPLVDSRGRLVGVNALIDDEGQRGIGVAVPVRTVRSVVTRLIEQSGL